MITYYFRSLKDSELRVVEGFRSGVWIHVESPSDEEVEQLISELGLDADLIQDARDFYEVPRLDLEGQHSYFFTRYPRYGQKEPIDTAPLLIVMGNDFVMTMVIRDVPCLERLLDGRLVAYTTQKTKLFIHIMELVTKAFDTELIKLRRAVHRERGQIQKIGTREIQKLVSYETRLNGMVDALYPTNTWLRQVPNGNYMKLYSDDIDLTEALMIDNDQVVNSARSVLKTIQNIRASTEAIMSSRLNSALQVLTVLTILLTIPLVVASVYGMNVPLPMQDSEATFWLLLGGNVIVLAGLTWVFRRNNWF